MPEGDTIRRLADKIGRRFTGERCERCVTRDPRLVGVDLAGARIVDVDANGKHLFIRFDNGSTLHSHLMMTGSWTVGPAAREPEWRRRVELWMETGRLTGVDLPIVELLPTTLEHTVVDHLGPDLCAPSEPDLDEVTERLQRDPSALLATALLDQRNVAGFGNVYAIEVPFIAGVSPNQPVGSDRWFARSRRCRRRADPHQCRARAAEHHRTPPRHRRPLDLRQARPTVPDCARRRSMVGTSATARGTEFRCGARRVSGSMPRARSTPPASRSCSLCTRPAANPPSPPPDIWSGANPVPGVLTARPTNANGRDSGTPGTEIAPVQRLSSTAGQPLTVTSLRIHGWMRHSNL